MNPKRDATQPSERKTKQTYKRGESERKQKKS